MIKRERDYLEKRKKKYLISSLVWLVVMFSIFLLGYLFTQTRKNFATVIAAVLVLPVANYSTQLFAILKFKDPDVSVSESIEQIKGKYSLFHSVLIPGKTRIIYINHIVVTGSKIFCILDDSKNINEVKNTFNQKVKTKGISLNQVVYIDLNKEKDVGDLIKKIQRYTLSDNKDSLKEYTQLISQMMM